MCETFLILGRTERETERERETDRPKMYSGLHVKCMSLLSDFRENKFSTDFRKNSHTSNSIKIRSVRADLFYVAGRADGRRDMRKLTAAFRNFVNGR